MKKSTFAFGGKKYPLIEVNTLVVGSGAASLSAADHLHKFGQEDLAIVTERVGGGTSNNTGSDKQTYYKLSVNGAEGDSPRRMADSLFGGGCMHGDLALIESICSSRGFFRLVELGMPFPHNRLGGYVGYKTDHDPAQRATSAGPWTSNQMYRCLLKEVQRREIPIFDGFDVVGLIAGDGRVGGVVALDKKKASGPTHGLTIFKAENVVFGVGGPGGLYKTSVYPVVHSGAIGLALEAGAEAVNLTESQYGLASIDFRWNVSGTYQQVLPRYFSCAQDGTDEKDFLNEHFESMGQLASAIFLKGYQWPFDPRKIQDHGSSLIDLLVYIETAVKGRKVYMDFRENPRPGSGLGELDFSALSPEAHGYLERSGALFGTPIQRLEKMNAMAIDLYKSHNIDLRKKPLRVAVCAQHNNGGLAGDLWWESTNLKHLFPVGEVNGSHGVYRPGGSALNSGQVGSLRAAQRISHAYRKSTQSAAAFKKQAGAGLGALLPLIRDLKKNMTDKSGVPAYLDELQTRMTASASHIRARETAGKALAEAYAQIGKYPGVRIKTARELPEALKLRHLVLAHAAYLEAIRAYLEAGGGSRGSYLVADPGGLEVLPGKLGDWRFKPEDPAFREKMLLTRFDGKTGRFASSFAPRRPIPEDDSWFENVWGDFVKGKVFE